MKILLIGFNIQEDIFPLGLTYLKAMANQRYPDIEVIVKEFTFGRRVAYDVNANIELQALNYIMLEKPDLVCFGTYIWSAEIIKNICKALRKISDVKIALGGVEITGRHSKFCDYAITGEGESQFVALIDQLKGKVAGKGVADKEEVSDLRESGAGVADKEVADKGITDMRKSGIGVADRKAAGKDVADVRESGRMDPVAKPQVIRDLDTIPFPYRYHEGKKHFGSVRIETSRGCPYGCGYCYYAKQSFREFSIEYLEENIRYLFDNFEFSNLTILDSAFNLNKERMKNIIRIIESQNRRIRLFVELKPELIDEDVVSILDSSRLHINCELGLQSISEEVLKACNRPYDIAKVKKGLELLNRKNITYKIDMMHGLPGDTFFRFLRTVNFIMKHSRQRSLPSHHLMLLNNTDLMDKHSFMDGENLGKQNLEGKQDFMDKSSVQACPADGLIRFLDDSSSMVIKTGTQDVTDIYRQKLLLDSINRKKRDASHGLRNEKTDDVPDEDDTSDKKTPGSEDQT